MLTGFHAVGIPDILTMINSQIMKHRMGAGAISWLHSKLELFKSVVVREEEGGGSVAVADSFWGLCCLQRQLRLGLLPAAVRAWDFRRRLGLGFFPLSPSLLLWVFTIGLQSLKNININVFYDGPLVNPEKINGFPFRGLGIECYYMMTRPLDDGCTTMGGCIIRGYTLSFQDHAANTGETLQPQETHLGEEDEDEDHTANNGENLDDMDEYEERIKRGKFDRMWITINLFPILKRKIWSTMMKLMPTMILVSSMI
ncbi:hypothetical protein SO802_017376 [Lithocarpus litseifolius]|uniref:Uncharacterized protein n=1 Tax=Lithocarpus litseifolius TaxID=425828 RepID=A0AAW2CJS5_9ROSI